MARIRGKNRRPNLNRGSTSKTIPTESKTDQDNEVVDKVLSNPLLIDKILEYSVHEPNGKEIDVETVRFVRLVNKKWLQSTSRVLKKVDHPLIEITVGLENEKRMKNVLSGNVLEHFVSVFSGNSSSEDSILPVFLHLEELCFTKKEKGDSLRNFLEKCSDRIFNLEVTYPSNGKTKPFKCDDINFPNLQILEFNFQSDGDGVRSESNANGLALLKDILLNSKNLKEFEFRNIAEAPVDISSLTVPTTLEGMTLGGSLNHKDLKFFENNQLPNFKSLKLDVEKQEEVDVMFEALQFLNEKLTEFTLEVIQEDDDSDEEDEDDENDQARGICIKFPAMEKLNCLAISGVGFHLDPQLKHVWSKLVPNLTRFILDNVKKSQFFDVVQNTSFGNVKKLKLAHLPFDENALNMIAPNEQVCKQILDSFPNIQKLTFNFDIEEICGLKYLFLNLTHLKKLRLAVDATDYDEDLRSKILSTFLGITIPQAKSMVKNKGKNFKIDSDNPFSIMNLKELNSFTMKISRTDFSVPKDDPFCLKPIRRFGLERMPNLQKIKLSDGGEDEVDTSDRTQSVRITFINVVTSRP